MQAINESGISSIEYNLDGTIVTANESFQKLVGYSLREIQNKHHRMLVDPAYAMSPEYSQFWKDLAAGISAIR